MQANQFLIMTPMCLVIFYVIFGESLTLFMILESFSACVVLMSYQQNSQELTEDGV